MVVHGLAALSSWKELRVSIGETVGSRTSVDAEKRIISWPAANRAPNPWCSARSVSHYDTHRLACGFRSNIFHVTEFVNGGIRHTTHPTHTTYVYLYAHSRPTCRSQWPGGLKRRSAAARLLRSWVRIPPGGMDVCCECCVLSDRGLCYELITRPEVSPHI